MDKTDSDQESPLDAPELAPEWQWLLCEGSCRLESDSLSGGLTSWQKMMLDEQVQLQKRGLVRIPYAQSWLWTDRSLSQASDWSTAVFKSKLVPIGASVIDGCCGAGVDLAAFGLIGGATGIEQDPLLCRIAEHNAAAIESSVACHQGDVLQEVTSPGNENTWLHVDPDRRATGRKSTTAEDFSPPIDQLLEVADKAFAGAIIKIAPSTQISSSLASKLSQRCTRVWVGSGTECKQQLLLLGYARNRLLEFAANSSPDQFRQLSAEKGSARKADTPLPMSAAVWLPNRYGWPEVQSGSGQAREPVILLGEDTSNDHPDTENAVDHWSWSDDPYGSANTDFAKNPGRFVFDIHRILHVAKLAREWASSNEIMPLSDSSGYFTSDEVPAAIAPWAQVFELIEVCPWDDRKLRKRLRSLDAGTVEVKNRLCKLDASAAQKRYSRPEGSEEYSLLVTLLRGKQRCLICRRISNTSGPL
ncbi:MAG: THUMP-like domain-containing protein [Aureliella sp.]